MTRGLGHSYRLVKEGQNWEGEIQSWEVGLGDQLEELGLEQK